jgi:hypothetical protein
MKNLFAGLLLLPALYLAKPSDDNFKDWSYEQRLVWDDFKGAPVRNSDAAALTATHLGFSYSFSKGQISYEIICRFDKKKSWGLVKNDWILGHEQGHFDIAEIFARELNKEVSDYKFNKNTFQKDLDEIYREVMADKEAYQLKYDEETNFSRHKKNQEEWLKRIAKDLEELAPYASYQ